MSSNEQSGNQGSSSDIIVSTVEKEFDSRNRMKYDSNGLVISGFHPLTKKPYTEKQLRYFNRNKLAKLQKIKEQANESQNSANKNTQSSQKRSSQQKLPIKRKRSEANSFSLSKSSKEKRYNLRDHSASALKRQKRIVISSQEQVAETSNSDLI